jgi:hypothetical protein
MHGAVTPANVLVDEDDNAYVADFTVGDPLATEADDVQALGVLAAALLTGSAWRGDLSDLSATPDLRDVIAVATGPDLALRHRTVADFVAAFDEVLGGALATDGAGVEAENPYRGLAAFQEADAGRFFGRTALVERVAGRMADSRFLALVDASGSGKTSVVRAGVTPALRRGRVPGSDRWFIVQMTPGDSPYRALEAALLRIAVNPPGTLLEQLARDRFGIRDAADRVLPDDGSELLVVVDQFEELFTLAPAADAEAFMDALATAVTDPVSRVRVIITLRADFYDRPLGNPGMAELLSVHMETVVPMTAAELEKAIVAPAASVRVGVEPGLVAAVVADTQGQAGALPLLQYLLTELFERRETDLKADGYRQLGGVEGAVARRAEEVYGTLDTAGQEATQQLFVRLVTLGEGGEASRRRTQIAEFDRLESAASLRRAIAAFGDARLLSFDRDPATRSPTVEVAHEALLRAWPRLRDWIEDSREDIRTHRRLHAAAAEWDEHGRGDGPSPRPATTAGRGSGIWTRPPRRFRWRSPSRCRSPSPSTRRERGWQPWTRATACGSMPCRWTRW